MTSAETTRVWQVSATGRILHLVDLQGLTMCGRQFNPETVRTPKTSSDAPTLPFCQKCLRASLQKMAA